jgi:hypothetical protein
MSLFGAIQSSTHPGAGGVAKAGADDRSDSDHSRRETALRRFGSETGSCEGEHLVPSGRFVAGEFDEE